MSGPFYTWTYVGPSTTEIKNQIAELLDVPFRSRYSIHWGDYWRSPLGEAPIIAIYPNAMDEDGVLYVHGHPEVTVIVETDGLSDEQARVIQALGGIPIERYGDLST